MGFVKVVKNRAYFKRFQVKFRRRRECKTDYYARKRLIIQDKNKYNAPKYRFVVRVTNRDIIAQVFAAAIDHDRCIAAAYSHELRRYGVPLGLTNYAAAYCTGLLLARRINEKLKIPYEGQTEVNGEDYHVEEEEGKQAPFQAFFDIGLKRTTTGARIFGALKGACDGGLDIPHNDRRFPGSKKTDGKNWEANAETHRKYILGGHVAEYMTKLKSKDDEDLYNKQFKRFVAAGIEADALEGIYTKAHEAIRKNPFLARDAKEKAYFADARKAPKDPKHKPKKVRNHRVGLSIQQRKDKIRQKVAAFKKAAAGGAAPKK